MKDKLIRISVVLALMLFGLFIYCINCHADEIDNILPYLIKVESGGNPNAVSSAGAVGLCQVTPIVLREYNREMTRGTINIAWLIEKHYEDLFDPTINKEIATWYLRRLRDHYGCKTIEQVLAAYNGGITRLRANDYDINKMPKETRDYVKKIMKLYKKPSTIDIPSKLSDGTRGEI